MRRGRRRSRQRPSRCGDDDMGRGCRCFAGGALAQRRGGPRRTDKSRARSIGARPSRHFRYRRYRDRYRSKWPNGPGHCAGGKADGAIRRQVDRATHRRPGGTGSVSLHAPGRTGDHRPPRGGGEIRLARTQGIYRLAVLERGAHLFPHRNSQPLHRRLQLVLELSDLPARRAADHPARTKPET